jgi:hypothetical protein
MNGNSETAVDRDSLLETLAAELALTAYRIALRTRTEGTWLDLELDLWRALADTARTWGDEIASVPLDGDAARAVQLNARIVARSSWAPAPVRSAWLRMLGDRTA